MPPSELRVAHLNGVSPYFIGEAAGALPVGSRIRKVDEEPGDTTTIGATGRILSSLDAHEVAEALRSGGQLQREVTYFYFVEWDWHRGVAVGIVDWKIGPA